MADLFVGTDHTLWLLGLKDQDDNVVEGATVVSTLLDKKYKPLNISPFPISLVDKGNGDYSAQIPDDVQLEIGSSYYIKINITKNGVDREYYTERIIFDRSVLENYRLEGIENKF